MNFLKVSDISFSYQIHERVIPILSGVSLEVNEGDFIAIQGRSGSGKSTFFHLLGCLLKPDSGKIELQGKDLTHLTSDELAVVRNQQIGFVFQQFHLLPRASVLENILLPSLYPSSSSPLSSSQMRDKAISLATQVGLEARLHSLPNQLSGGEQQRVVIARALLSDANLILADEPTGNLDTQNAANILSLFRELNKKGKTIILITHDEEVARQCPTRYHMVDGRFLDYRPLPSPVSPSSSLPVHSPVPQKPLSLWPLIKTVTPLALQNLKRSKARSFLTMIGVTVGIASVFAMLTFGKFAQEKVMKGYEELGANTLGIVGNENWRRKATDKIPTLFDSFDWKKDVLPTRSVFPEIKHLSPLAQSWGNSVTFGGLAIENDVVAYGVNENFLTITKKPLLLGRNFSPHHIELKSPVCLIGSEIHSRLFSSVNPVGKIFFVFNGDQIRYPCEVIGVLAPQTSSKDWRKPNLEVYVPFTYFRTVHNFWDSGIHFFAAQLTPGTDIERTANGVKEYFQQKYQKGGEFNVMSDTRLVGQMKKSLTLFTALLTAIALITLTVGGIGINNMMLVSVTERFKEIGLRKAVGATDRTIRFQFLLESLILAVIAGLTGVVLGFGAYEVIIYATSKAVAKMPFEWVVEPLPLLFSVCSMLVVGILSGIVPALKAERLQVIEALRAE